MGSTIRHIIDQAICTLCPTQMVTFLFTNIYSHTPSINQIETSCSSILFVQPIVIHCLCTNSHTLSIKKIITSCQFIYTTTLFIQIIVHHIKSQKSQCLSANSYKLSIKAKVPICLSNLQFFSINQ